jgi:hypothetical protein
MSAGQELCLSNLSRHGKGAELRRSRRQLTPFGQGGGTVLFEDVAAVEVSVLIETIMDRGVDGGELLPGPRPIAGTAVSGCTSSPRSGSPPTSR